MKHAGTGKELLLSVLRHEKTSTVPWVPYAGIHAGKLKGYSAMEVLKDPQKLLESQLAVNEVYNPDGQPVMFDLQLEAEILGCELYWAEQAPPSVVSHPWDGIDEFPQRVPQPDEGRLPMVLDVMRQMKKEVGNHTALYGLVTGPLTLAAHMRGTDIFMDMVLNPDVVHKLVSAAALTAKQVANYYLDVGMDVIAVVDPLVSQISPKHFTKYLLEPFSDVFTNIRARQAYSAFFVCGDATKNIPVMCQTLPDAIAVDENIHMVEAKVFTDAANITLSGNIPLTTQMLLGTQQDNMKYVIDLLDSLDTHNFILAPGCDMPYDTPIENVVGCMEAVRHPAETRKLLETYSKPPVDLDSVILPAYTNLEKPLVELFTLDSAMCAACMYMVQAAKDAASDFGDQVDLVEYKFTNNANVARVMKMGVQNLPSLYINGELKYSSIIPDHTELADEIRSAMKGRVS